MPKVSGKDLISGSTEKSLNKLLLFASAAILAKTYDIPLGNMKLLSVDIPAAVFDVSLLVLTMYFLYVFVVKWIGDVTAFRSWYRETSIWSEFGTNMKLDKTFINGGVDLLKSLNELEKKKAFPQTFDNLDAETRKKYDDFKANAELYAVRLGNAGTKFSYPRSATSTYGSSVSASRSSSVLSRSICCSNTDSSLRRPVTEPPSNNPPHRTSQGAADRASGTTPRLPDPLLPKQMRGYPRLGLST
jgi:hypothetical protein